MTEPGYFSDLRGGELENISVNWGSGTVELSVVQPSKPGHRFTLRFIGFDHLKVPRHGSWRGAMNIAHVHGPMDIDRDQQHLCIEMQSGDVIELDYRTHEFTPSLSPAPETTTVTPPHPELPYLHDAPLRDVHLSWPEGTAALTFGPLYWRSAAEFGAEYVTFTFAGVRRIVFPRRLPWDYFNPDVLHVLGPVRVEADAWHLRLFMQDGDVIELDYQSRVVTPTTIADDSRAPSR